MEEWIPVKEASEKLDVSSRTVTNWINQRKLKAKRGQDGREWLVHASLGPAPDDWVQDTSQSEDESAADTPTDARDFSEQSATQSDLRSAIEQALDARRKEVSVLERTNDFLQKQLESRDEQIDHLHQLLALSQTNLQREQLALEQVRTEAQPWWKRLLGNNPKPSDAKEKSVKGKAAPAFD